MCWSNALQGNLEQLHNQWQDKVLPIEDEWGKSTHFSRILRTQRLLRLLRLCVLRY